MNMYLVIMIVSLCLLIRQVYLLSKIPWRMVILKWWKERKAERDRKDYQHGFDWVIKAHFIEGMSVETIEAYCYGSSDPFDKGCNESLRNLYEYEKVSASLENSHD